jgi:hypothetical protein
VQTTLQVQSDGAAFARLFAAVPLMPAPWRKTSQSRRLDRRDKRAVARAAVLPHWGVWLAAGHSLGAGLSAIRQFGVGVATALAAALSAGAAQAQDCHLVAAGTATVRAASAAGIVLEDGRTVRLAGLDLVDAAQAAPPAGTVVTLKRLATAAETDRYGRLAAHVFISENNEERWFQAEVVRRGLARVARVGDTACARALLAQEHAARAAKLGLWGEPVYVMNKAADPAEVLKQRGRFALVEGTVLSVRESGGTIYVNFGRRWSEDFTVTIAKRNERAFSAAGLEPKTLAGKRVRVRGWIEERGGPWVEAARPEQIEVIN